MFTYWAIIFISCHLHIDRTGLMCNLCIRAYVLLVIYDLRYRHIVKHVIYLTLKIMLILLFCVYLSILVNVWTVELHY